MEKVRQKTLDDHKEQLLSLINPLLYLRQTGGESLIEFHQKPIPCMKHWQQHANEIGINRVLTVAEELIPLLAKEANISIDVVANDYIYFTFIHPLFENDFIKIRIEARELAGEKQEKINNANQE